MSSPSISTCPEVGGCSRFRQRTSVDLPEPERPITTKISPAPTLNETSLTATTQPLRFRTSALPWPSRSRRSALSVSRTEDLADAAHRDALAAFVVDHAGHSVSLRRSAAARQPGKEWI